MVSLAKLVKLFGFWFRSTYFNIALIQSSRNHNDFKISLQNCKLLTFIVKSGSQYCMKILATRGFITTTPIAILAFDFSLSKIYVAISHMQNHWSMFIEQPYYVKLFVFNFTQNSTRICILQNMWHAYLTAIQYAKQLVRIHGKTSHLANMA